LKSQTAEEIIEKIDELHKMHLSLRGTLQYVKEDKIGDSQLSWGSSTDSNWFDIQYNFTKPITQESREELNRLSEFMNQNFIVRLHSLLDYEEIKSKKVSIDKSLSGYKMIEVVHFLRTQFAHRPGRFDPNDNDSVILRERLFEEFNISPEESLPDQFPLDKNRVIVPIVNGVKNYVHEFWVKYRMK
jgi:hypothetical protein